MLIGYDIAVSMLNKDRLKWYVILCDDVLSTMTYFHVIDWWGR